MGPRGRAPFLPSGSFGRLPRGARALGSSGGAYPPPSPLSGSDRGNLMESIHYGYRTNARHRPVLPPAEGATPGQALRDACEELVSASLRMARFDANGEGISIPQSFVLLTLEKLGSVPIRDLIAWSGNSPATVGGILDGLESMGAVQREHGVEDRRHVLVSLTAEGHRRAARLEARRAERWETLREKLGEADASVVARVL